MISWIGPHCCGSEVDKCGLQIRVPARWRVDWTFRGRHKESRARVREKSGARTPAGLRIVGSWQSVEVGDCRTGGVAWGGAHRPLFYDLALARSRMKTALYPVRAWQPVRASGSLPGSLRSPWLPGTLFRGLELHQDRTLA